MFIINVKWIMMLYCTNREHSKIIVFMYFYNIEWMLINDNSASTDLLAADLKFFVKLNHLLFTPFFNENMIIFLQRGRFWFSFSLNPWKKKYTVTEMWKVKNNQTQNEMLFWVVRCMYMTIINKLYFITAFWR